jgi:2'-5' RNA ligase
MARLFLAVWPPEDVAAELTHLHRKETRGVRFVRPEHWHITLRFLGEARPAEVVEALDGIALSPATARLGPAVDVLAERALVVPVTGLDDLAATVRERTKRIGDPPPKRFAGHLTVARLKPGALMPRTLGAAISTRFEVEDLTLVQSRLGPQGPRYDTLASWALG